MYFDANEIVCFYYDETLKTYGADTNPDTRLGFAGINNVYVGYPEGFLGFS